MFILFREPLPLPLYPCKKPARFIARDTYGNEKGCMLINTSPHYLSSALVRYQEGRIYGVDLASMLAVHAMRIHPDDHVLDVCCAPGAKLCAIADILHEGTGTVTGLDLSSSRLATCRSLCRKYLQDNVRLVQGDGTIMSIAPPEGFTRTSQGNVRSMGKKNLSCPYTKPQGPRVFWASKPLRSPCMMIPHTSFTDRPMNHLYDKASFQGMIMACPSTTL